MKRLNKSDMKQLIGGLRPPLNGVCYNLGENCSLTWQCCPHEALVCVGGPGGTCVRLED